MTWEEIEKKIDDEDLLEMIQEYLEEYLEENAIDYAKRCGLIDPTVDDLYDYMRDHDDY